MADVEFFWDPICPWAWLTSRWVVNVLDVRPMAVDWRFICLRMVNADMDYGDDTRHERAHTLGLELLRVAAAVRAAVGPEAMLPLYTAFGTTIHNRQDGAALSSSSGVGSVLEDLGYAAALADASTSTDFDAIIQAETKEALDRCGGNIGTPVLSFAPPDGPSFFGPVIAKAPKGDEALKLWDAVQTLGSNPWFSELKRSTRSRPQFED